MNFIKIEFEADKLIQTLNACMALAHVNYSFETLSPYIKVLQ